MIGAFAARVTDAPSRFDDLVAQAPDALLNLIALHRADDRSRKIDLGIGVFRDETGMTPVMRAVKSAERVLAASIDFEGMLADLTDECGMFALLPISPAVTASLREQHGIYISVTAASILRGRVLTPCRCS